MAKQLKSCFICGKKIEEGKDKDYFDGIALQPVHRLCLPKPTRTNGFYNYRRN